MRAQEDFEERHRDRQDRGQRPPAPALSVRRPRQRDQRPQSQGQSGDHRVRERQREEQVPAQQIRPPVRLRIEREREGEVGRHERPAGESHSHLRQAQARRGRAHGEQQRDGEDSHVESRDGIVRVDRGPAQRGRAHEVRAQVIAQREPRHSGHLRRIAEGQLADETDMERGVVGDERVEQELAGIGHAIPPVLGHSQEKGDGKGRTDRPPQRRARRRGAYAFPG